MVNASQRASEHGKSVPRLLVGGAGLLASGFLGVSEFMMLVMVLARSDSLADRAVLLTLAAVGAAVCGMVASLGVLVDPGSFKSSPAVRFAPPVLFLLGGAVGLLTGAFSPLLFWVLAGFAFWLRPGTSTRD